MTVLEYHIGYQYSVWYFQGEPMAGVSLSLSPPASLGLAAGTAIAPS
jgi:hypothetical protein